MRIPYFDSNGEMLVLEGTVEEIREQINRLKVENDTLLVNVEPVDD